MRLTLNPCSRALSPAHARGVSRWVVLVVLLVTGLAIAGGGVWVVQRVSKASASSGQSNAAAEWAKVRREPIPVIVVAEGDLVAKDQVDILNLIDHPDDETIETIVEEGTWVKEGDWLYTLSAPGLVSDRDEQLSRVREAEAKVEEARRNLEIEKDTAASAEDKARLTLELAQLAHKQWEQGTDPQKVRDLNLALEKAERELEQAKREVGFSKELYEKDFISKRELEEDEIALIEAENALETAKLDIEVYNKYEKVKQEKELISEIEQAQDELERTIRKNENKLELLQATIDSEDNELKQRETRLVDLQRMVDRLTINAPRDGMVIYASTIGVGWEKYRTIRPGAGLRGGQRVMVLSNTTQMVANLYVHESRINEIENGQKVSIKVNARPDDVFTAIVVGKKNSAIQNSSGNPHLRQYQVLAELPPNLGDDIRPGMNCSGEIYIREIPETLAVPIQAVHTEGGEHFVYVKADSGKVRKQPIRMGGSSDTLVQIKAGLDAGTQVLLRNPRPGEVLSDGGQPLPEIEPAAASLIGEPVEAQGPGAGDKPTVNTSSDRPRRRPDGGAGGERSGGQWQGQKGGDRPNRPKPAQPQS